MMTRRYLLFFTTILLLSKVYAQRQQNVLELTPEQIEAIFIKQNLDLIAEKMSVSIADAAIAQARLWENPSLSIDGVNFWSTNAQRGGEREVIPPLFGSFARNTQFSVELSQLVSLSGKRSKLIGMEKVSKEIAMAQFEDVLRGLKAELRKSVCEMIYLSSYRKVLETQSQSLSLLIDTYTKQVAQGNLAKNELLRLQAALFEVENELNEIQSALNGQQKNIKALLNAEPFVVIEILDGTRRIPNPEHYVLADLTTSAMNARPDVTKSKLQTEYYGKSLKYEKSQRVPDVAFGVNYDRRGGVWHDFVGFSMGMDIPLFNRNQGNIKAAKLSISQSSYQTQKQQNLVQQEVVEAYHNYAIAYGFYKKIDNNPLIGELDSMLEVYAHNLIGKNISMLEYIDFMDTYKSTKQTWLTAQKNVSVQFEELQYTVGTKIK
ncbi:MAG: TolC family protein [Bacteroides sp.]